MKSLTLKSLYQRNKSISAFGLHLKVSPFRSLFALSLCLQSREPKPWSLIMVTILGLLQTPHVSFLISLDFNSGDLAGCFRRNLLPYLLSDLVELVLEYAEGLLFD
jgi:hypothetical protein